MRFLAIDLGDKRTGLAVGDTESGIVTPDSVIEVERGERLLNRLTGAIDEHCPDAIVVGLPLNMDDSEGPRATLTRSFGHELQRRIALPVHFQDERLTSDAANDQMAQSGLTHKQKKSRRDALAAAAILRDFLRDRG